jgi:predicted Holliday junction resolvase-like endonuclease
MTTLLSLTWIILVLFSIVLLFKNIFLAITTFTISTLLVVLVFNMTPEGKVAAEEHAVKAKAAAAKKQLEAEETAAKKQLKAEEKERAAKRAALAATKAAEELQKNTEELQKNYEQLSINPTDVRALNYFLDILEGLDRKKLKPLIGSVILPLLSMKPLDERVRAVVFSCAQRTTSKFNSSNQVISQLFYDMSLNILQQHPESQALKIYALEVGRWHCSIARTDGKVTTYDEQSIQNDILVRSR